MHARPRSLLTFSLRLLYYPEVVGMTCPVILLVGKEQFLTTR